MSPHILDFLGPVVRHIPGKEKTLYLTFDDGPEWSTPKILEVLERQGVKATFFMISDKARKNNNLAQKVLASGHSIGNHSLDHRYGQFFGGKKAILQWVKQSHKVLSDLFREPPVGFRPPAGVCTPKLHWALKELQIPLILWQRRFFDTSLSWSTQRALKSLTNTVSGDIILLHDRQSHGKLPLFLNTLEFYIEAAKKQGFEFRALSLELCQNATIQKR